MLENTNYFREKYVDDNNENVGQKEQQNETNQNQNQSSSEEAVQQKLQLTEKIVSSRVRRTAE